MNMHEADFVRTSLVSNIRRTKTFMVDPAKLFEYNRGRLLVQEAFPHLSADDREFIVSGITAEEWEKSFAHHE